MANKKAAEMASGKREPIAPHGDKRLIRRNENGRIRESDDLGKSLSSDVSQAAKNTVAAGQGDQGDREKNT